MFLIADYIARKMLIMIEWFFDIDTDNKPLNFQIFEFKLADNKFWYEEDLKIKDSSIHVHRGWEKLTKKIIEYKSPIL